MRFGYAQVSTAQPILATQLSAPTSPDHDEAQTSETFIERGLGTGRARSGRKEALAVLRSGGHFVAARLEKLASSIVGDQFDPESPMVKVRRNVLSVAGERGAGFQPKPVDASRGQIISTTCVLPRRVRRA